MPSDSPAGPFVLAIDGPAGAGKTTVAAALAAWLGPHVRCAVVAMDLLDDGWDGLAAGIAQADAVLDALDSGRTATYRRYDWNVGGYTETVEVPPSDVVIIEGVGAGATQRRADRIVWVDAPATLRRQRGEARGDFGDQWERWAQTEATHFAAARTAQRADLVVSGTDLLGQITRMGWFARLEESG